MSNYLEKTCKLSGVVWKQYNSLQKCPCEQCKDKRKPPNLKLKSLYKIPKQSKKRQIENAKYLVLRIEFLSKPENQICPITGWETTEVHHTYSGKDRSKYFLDVSTWLAVSRDGHNWIHDNPKEAREKGFLK